MWKPIVFLVLSWSRLTQCSFKREVFRSWSHLLVQVNKRNSRTINEICLNVTTKTLKRCYWHHSGVFILNFLTLLWCFHCSLWTSKCRIGRNTVKSYKSWPEFLYLQKYVIKDRDRKTGTIFFFLSHHWNA